MHQLTNAQRKYLRKLAHHLHPVTQVGKQGVTEHVMAKINQELEAHELIKIRFIGFQDQKQELAGNLAERLDAVLVGMIGHIALLYRQHPNHERRRIQLPARYAEEHTHHDE